MFRHYCVFLRELVVSTLLCYINMSMQSLLIQFKISHVTKTIKMLKLSKLK